MTYTNFPDGVTSFGIPSIGGGTIPPFNGNWFFVDPASGSDGNNGSAAMPFATLTRAYNQTVTGNNDVIVLYGNGLATGTARLSATLNWANNATHLIGVGAPVPQFGRCRIAAASTATVFTPMVHVTGAGCNFWNFSLFAGFADASPQVAWLDEGGRNYYSNVHFGGIGSTLAAADAGSRSLVIGKTTTLSLGENVFQSCTIGLDTVARQAANFNLEFLGNSPRNKFKDCLFTAYIGSSGTAGSFIKAGVDSIDRNNDFIGCRFLNQTKSAASTMAQALNVSSSAGGMLVLQDCAVFGITALETSASSNVVGMGPAAGATTIAKALATTW